MIRLHRGLAILLAREPGEADDQWLDQLAATPAALQTMLLEGIEQPDAPRCPSCLAVNEDYQLPAGAGLVICHACVKPFVALRFYGQNRLGTWFTFPWSE